MGEIFRKLISYTGQAGPSSTKFVWLHAGIGSMICSCLMVAGGVGMYIGFKAADPTYWAAVVALWTATLGFAGSVKKNQDNQDRNPPDEK